MAKTCQDVLTAAIALSDANQAFTSLGAAEILAQLQRAQAKLFTQLTQENRFFYVRSAAVSSSAGASARTLDLSALNPPLERLLDRGLVLPDARTINVVDFQDQDAELAPRAYPTGLVLNEVGNEWSAVSGAVPFTVVYAYRPADFDLGGALSQVITVPDRFSAWLDYELGIYFNQKDIGRAVADPDEIKRLAALQAATYKDIVQYLDHVMGPAIRRFVVPIGYPGEKK